MSSYFLFEDHFSKPTYFIKNQDTVCGLKFVILAFSVLLVLYMITFHPYQSQKCAIIAFLGLTFFYSFPEYEKQEGFAIVP